MTRSASTRLSDRPDGALEQLGPGARVLVSRTTGRGLLRDPAARAGQPDSRGGAPDGDRGRSGRRSPGRDRGKSPRVCRHGDDVCDGRWLEPGHYDGHRSPSRSALLDSLDGARVRAERAFRASVGCRHPVSSPDSCPGATVPRASRIHGDWGGNTGCPRHGRCAPTFDGAGARARGRPRSN